MGEVIGQMLSSWIYYYRGAPRSLIGEGVKRILCAVVQIFFNFLDKISKNEGVTLGYIIVAKKARQ